MAPATPDPQRIAAVRRFNRFYTRQIGVLRKNYLDSPYSLGEMRVLYEIANAGDEAPTASDVGRALDLDAGYLSRVLRNFEKNGLIARKTSATDARQSHLTLTARGRKVFAPLEQRSQDHVAAMLARLDASRASAAGGGDGNHRRPARRRYTCGKAGRHLARAEARRLRLDRQPPRRDSMRRNTAGAIRSKACARRSSPTSSTSKIRPASAAGSPR